VRGQIVPTSGERLALESASGEHRLRILTKTAPSLTGLAEVRGELWDVGRMGREDPRFAGYDIETIVAETGKNWPGIGELLILNLTNAQRAQPPLAPGVRTIALEPERYLNQQVTVSGRFRGRNLYGDLPDAPAKSRWDFVLQSADAAIWIIALRPRGKDFNLDVNARVDTGRWLEIKGTVASDRGLVWLVGSELRLGRPASEPEVEPPVAERREPIPPDVLFSAPTSEESDVNPAGAVRIQFSRDMNDTTFRGRVRVTYFRQESAERGEPQPSNIQFTTHYNAASRVLEIRFAQPLDRFKRVKVELLEGIVTTDNAPLKPWSLQFWTGG
ncbi:MAG: Ig-like domain-containing protein, partial [Acidimicrobiia bacterium]